MGTGRKLRDGSDVAVLTIGPIGNDVEEILASSNLPQLGEASNAENSGAATSPSLGTEGKVAHYDMRFLKPLDEDILHEVGRKFQRVVTIEDGVRIGGLGSAVMVWMGDHGYRPLITRLGLPDQFVEHGEVEELREIVGLDKESIRKAIQA